MTGAGPVRRIQGFIINRFRGDIALLEPGLRWLEQKAGKPVLGVLPYLHELHLKAEDGLGERLHWQSDERNRLQVAVPLLPTFLTELITLYLMIVTARVLGVMYYVNRERLDWFRRSA